jgi:hypothetical protein
VGSKKWVAAMSFPAIAGLVLMGCENQKESTPAASERPGESSIATPATRPIIPQVQMVDWCPEHGVPESICARCNKAVADSLKQKGDWCAGHGVPESQCFICHPELKAKFAAGYKARYGKEPPATQPESAEKNS